MLTARAHIESLLKARKLDVTLTSVSPLCATSALVHQPPADDLAASGVPSIDVALGGGFERGHLSEIVGGRSSGRTSAVCHALGAAASRGELVALVDTCDRFDPESAAATGLDLSRLLWIRETGDATRALKAMNLVLQAGGFGLVVLDLADVPVRTVRALPFTTWFRLARVIEGSPTVALLVAAEHVARSSGGATIEMDPAKTIVARPGVARARWTGRSDRARLLRGLATSPRVVGGRSCRAMSSLYACLRSPRRPDVAVDVAKEFSPRLQRYGTDCVVLDVSGLGRLLGEPPAIGGELESRIADLSHGTRIADSSHGTRISRIADPLHGTRISRIADPPHGTRISRIADSSHGTRITRIPANLHEDDHGPRHSASLEEDFQRSARSASRDDLRSRVAVAPTQIAAMLLSSAYPGLTVVTGDVESALAPVRLEVLRHVFAEIHGVSMFHELWRSAKSASREKDQRSAKSASREKDQRSASRGHDPRSGQAFEILERWGLTTLGEFAALPAGALSARLGQTGIALQRMARGVDACPLVPDPDVSRFLERVELEWPIDGLEPLAFVLARVLEPLSAALERADRAAAAIHLNLRLVDRTEHARMLQLPAAMRDPKVLRTLLVLDLESHPPHAAIDIVTIEIDPAPGRVLQYSLLERARPSAETLATLTARLGALVGESRCGQAILLDSHGPDAFEMCRFAPDDAPPAPVTSADALVASTNACVASAFRRKDAPESAVLRRFRPPMVIRVTIERGRPRYVFIDRRGMPGGQVEQCAGPWRSSGAWWGVRPWNRDEWDVALNDGSVCRLFQARDSEQWFLDGVFD